MHRTAPPYNEVIVQKVPDILSKYGEGLTSVMLNSYDESASISVSMLSENTIV